MHAFHCEAGIDVVVVDGREATDSELLRLIAGRPGIRVAGHALNWEAIPRRKQGQRAPVLVADVDAVRLDGIPPAAAVVIVSVEGDLRRVRALLRSGARAYLLKGSPDSDLLRAVRAVAAGRTYLDPLLGARLVGADTALEALPDGLTRRELQVVELVALGYTNADAAARLGLSVRTVESHRVHIQDKVRFRSRAELVRYAIEHGMLGP